MARDQGLLPTAMGGAAWEQSPQPSRAFRWCETPARGTSRLPRAPAQGNCEVTMFKVRGLAAVGYTATDS